MIFFFFNFVILYNAQSMYSTNNCTLLHCSYMFHQYCVILNELIVSTLPSYTSLSLHLLVIQFKISHMFYAVEISMFKILNVLKLS